MEGPQVIMSVEGVAKAIDELSQALRNIQGVELSSAERLPRKLKKRLKTSYDDWRMNEVLKALSGAILHMRQPMPQPFVPPVHVVYMALRAARVYTVVSQSVKETINTSFKTYLYAHHFNKRSLATDPNTGRSYKRLERGRLTRQATRRIYAGLADIVRTPEPSTEHQTVFPVGGIIHGSIHSDVRLPNEPYIKASTRLYLSGQRSDRQILEGLEPLA
jgi:hypothetical protein